MKTMNLKFSSSIIILCISCVAGQRVAPGVPPQQYQHVPVHQQPNANVQHHQQQQIYQQQTQGHLPPGVAAQQYQQYQQVPVQNQQQFPVHSQQVPVQQAPVQQVHQGQLHQQAANPTGHHAPHDHHGQQQVLHTGNIREERAHIQEHMQVPIDTSKMSEAELQFHYFKMHDSDNNNKLDGCELIKSLIHWHADDDQNTNKDNTEKVGTGDKEGTIYTDQGLAEIIDYVLKTMDMNNDGYVDYPEYLTKNDEVGKD